MRRNDEIARQNGEIQRLTMGIPSAEITGPNTYPEVASGTAVTSTPFDLCLSSGLSAAGWFDRLTMKWRKLTPDSESSVRAVLEARSPIGTNCDLGGNY
ncbi:MAG: hypothetical protein VX947_04325, partial [Chloroflexota bacterium]|nr:hypothetical protein [Chloroflexota bacterium]